MEHINHSDIDTSLHCIRPRTSTPILQSSMAAADSSQGEFAVDPDWNPFPLKCKAEFEDLEILLSQSVDHRLVLLDFFRVFLSPDLGDWLQLLKLIVKDEAVAHVTSAKELETYWLFTATFVAFFQGQTNLHFAWTMQKFLGNAKRRIRWRSKRKASQTDDLPAKRLRIG